MGGVWSRFRPPLLVVALLLLALICLLATLQYYWLGQISQAERERMQATLSTGATEFAQDLDRELTRAYLLFQTEPGTQEEMATRLTDRYEQWQASARFPRLINALHVFTRDASGTPQLRRFDMTDRRLHSAPWPASMTGWQKQFEDVDVTQNDPSHRAIFIARRSPPIWESVPAVVVPMPMPLLLLNERNPPASSFFSYLILTIDVDYVKKELLPALAERHFSRGNSGLDFQVAVVGRSAEDGVIYSSTPSFRPGPDAKADATVDLFQIRVADFNSIASEVRRYVSLGAAWHSVAMGRRGSAEPGTTRGSQPSTSTFTIRESRPLSILVQPGAGAVQHGVTTTTRLATVASPAWKLMLKHPSGSLEAAVGSLRRRNLIVSSSILGVLGASMGLLVLSTRRAQRLARQQMEFVAAVSHELRTPLAVIRSAADNLADGVVRDEDQIKKYGELMRSEGRRLTEMVEQILELAGIQSGQRGFALRAVAVEPLIADIIASSSSLIERAGVEVEVQLPRDLPPVLGDQPALRRVFENLIGNAVKYGASGGWIGVSALRNGSEVCITVADRGMGIGPADQPRVFEPFYRASEAIAAQIQGAGLGLSLVQRIVVAHGGRVTLKSTPGAGSEFTVHLPAAGEEPIARPVERQGATQPASS